LDSRRQPFDIFHCFWFELNIKFQLSAFDHY
jgi:hypothetical protein